MIEDRWLIWRCKQGSRAAFQRIYEKYEGDLRTLAANLLNDNAAAEDVVHDVFISLLQVVDTFEIRTILANGDGQASSDNNGPVQWIIQTELSRQLDEAMSRLPYEQREAVVLYLHGQIKFKAIAKVQNVSIKTAHTRYRAGLDRLRSMLNSELEE